jgi:hypothetical protein
VNHDQFTVTDPREMRIKLEEMRRGRSFYNDGRISGVDAIVRSVHDLAEMRGLSGEDRYTVMAWHLLNMAARLEELALEVARTQPARPFFGVPM